MRFLHCPIAEASDAELSDVQLLMALRERTALDEKVLSWLPKLELILQTGGHAYHVITGCNHPAGYFSVDFKGQPSP